MEKQVILPVKEYFNGEIYVDLSDDIIDHLELDYKSKVVFVLLNENKIELRKYNEKNKSNE